MEGRPLGDAELVERAKEGNPGAFEELVRRHQALAIRVAYLVVGSRSDAEDAAQEGLLKAYRSLGSFRDGAPFRPWLLRIVANEARNRRKWLWRRPAISLDEAGHPPSGDEAPSPEETAEMGERRRRLVDALNGLRNSDRTVIAYRYLLDLSEAETAEILGCAVGTVKSRLSRALGRLREQMSQEVAGD